MKTEELEVLSDFFGSIFHLDWPLIYSTRDDVVDSYISLTRDPAQLEVLADALAALLTECDDDGSLSRVWAAEVEGYYSFPRAWLAELVERLRSAASATNHSGSPLT